MCQCWWFSHTSIRSLWKNWHFSGTSRTSLTNSPTGKEKLCQKQIWSWFQVKTTLTAGYRDGHTVTCGQERSLMRISWCAPHLPKPTGRFSSRPAATRAQHSVTTTKPWTSSLLPDLNPLASGAGLQHPTGETGRELPCMTSNTHRYSPPPPASRGQHS